VYDIPTVGELVSRIVKEAKEIVENRLKNIVS
jgi:hypothetical protein